MIKSLPWAYVPLDTQRAMSLRLALATALRMASAVLSRLARALAQSDRRATRRTGPRVLEFYAEAGAPEGALYIDGQLVGHIEGVTRL